MQSLKHLGNVTSAFRMRAFRVAVQLDLHLLGEAGIVLLEDLEHFGAAEMIGNVLALGEHLPKLGAGQHEPVFLAVGAGPHGGHAVALVAVERPVDLERLGFERALRDLVEDLLCVEGAVVVAHAGMVAADDQVAAAEVLAEERVQQRFARSGIAHVHGIAALDGTVSFTKYLSIRVLMASARTSAGISPSFSLPRSWWISTPSMISMAILARYSWERCMGFRVWNAAIVLQPLSSNILRVCVGRHVDALEGLGEMGLGEDLHRTGQVDVRLAHDLLHARVTGNVVGAEDHLALMLLVGLGHLVLLGHLHGGHDRASSPRQQGRSLRSS